MTGTHQDILRREVWIAARPEFVYEFLTKPEKMTSWMGIEADVEAKKGGIYRVNVTGEDIASGEFVEVTPHQRLIYSWGWEGGDLPPGSSTVEITLTPQNDGTLLRLNHSGLPADSVAAHGEGWEHYLQRLAVAAAGGNPGPDDWVKTPPKT